MAQRFKKLFTTLELEDAHVIQALMRRIGISCWLLRSNGLAIDPAAPLADVGYKLFLPDTQFEKGVTLFRDTFKCTTEPPYTGPLDLAFSGKSRSVPQSQLISDTLGPEEFIWKPPVGDPVGDAWKTADLLVCPKCGRQMAPGDNFCDSCGESLDPSPQTSLPSCQKCGHEMRTDSSICPTCGEIQ